jgi:hypothetical protein
MQKTLMLSVEKLATRGRELLKSKHAEGDVHRDIGLCLAEIGAEGQVTAEVEHGGGTGVRVFIETVGDTSGPRFDEIIDHLLKCKIDRMPSDDDGLNIW